MTLEVTFARGGLNLEPLKTGVTATTRALEQESDRLLDATRKALENMKSDTVLFAAGTKDRLRGLAEMLEDRTWQLSRDSRERALGIVAHFTKKEGLIPKSVPWLSFLDDAIMIDLAVQELSDDIETYRESKKAIQKVA